MDEVCHTSLRVSHIFPRKSSMDGPHTMAPLPQCPSTQEEISTRNLGENVALHYRVRHESGLFLASIEENTQRRRLRMVYYGISQGYNPRKPNHVGSLRFNPCPVVSSRLKGSYVSTHGEVASQPISETWIQPFRGNKRVCEQKIFNIRDS